MMGAGLLLMASIVVFFLIGFVFAIFGALLFGAGLWLTWQSDAPDAAKLTATLLPLASFAVVVGAFLFDLRTEPTTILVPDGYRGPTAVVFNESCAPPPAREDGRRVVALAPDGIAISSGTEEAQGWGTAFRNNAYVVVDRGGRRLRALRVLGPSEYQEGGSDPADPDLPAAMNEYGPVENDQDAITSQTAYVGTVRSWRATEDMANEAFEQKMIRRVFACRRAAGQPDGGIPTPSEHGPS